MKPPVPPFAPCAPAMARPCYQIPYIYPAPIGEIKYVLRPCCPPCGGVEMPLPNYNPPRETAKALKISDFSVRRYKDGPIESRLVLARKRAKPLGDDLRQAVRLEVRDTCAETILKDANLASTLAKKARQEFEEKLNIKLQSHKKEIEDLVKEFLSSNKDGGKKDESEEEAGDEEEEESEEDKKKKCGSPAKKPPAKKAKKGSEDDSASDQSEGELEEEYSPKKATKPAKTRKLRPKKKNSSESDSDEDWGKKKGGKKEVGSGLVVGGAKKRGGEYTKSYQLSPELSALVGADSMARYEVVKKVWSIIKEKNLCDPLNKQYAICDDALLKVIGTKRFRTFGIMKYLKKHFIS